MMKKRTNSALVIALILGSVFSCAPPNKISVYDISFLYRDKDDFTDISCAVYHDTDTSSRAFVLIKLNDLFYKKPVPSSNYQASYVLSYSLTESYDSREILDSASYSYLDSANFGKDIGLIRALEIPTRMGQNYLLTLEITDNFRSESVRNYFWINKESRFGQQNFLALDSYQRPVFTSYVEGGERIKIKCNDPSIDKLYVRAYFRDFPVASPPFVMEKEEVFDFTADSIFEVRLYNGETSLLTLEKTGFYHFQKDTALKEGFTLYRFNDGYPQFVNASELIEPVRYITTRKEYQEIEMSADPKAAVDGFWLETAGSEARARNLIQKYYTNVQEANRFFTSYHEGWKTDRGLIYIVYGKPMFVYRGEGQEDWVYGAPENRNSLRFTFVQVQNPFTYNDFVLLRSPTFKDPWYITVQSWRR